MRRRFTAAASAVAILIAMLTGTAPPASATTTWDFASGTFTLDDGVGSQATVDVRNLRVTDGTIVRGKVAVKNPARSESCDTSTFSGDSAVFFTERYSPCNGSITFAVSASGVLTVSAASLYVPATLFTSPATGSAQGTAWLLTCTATLGGPTDATVSWTDPAASPSYDITTTPALAQPVSGAAGTTSAAVTGLTPGTSYRFTVAASGTAAPSPCTTPPVWTPPAAPRVDGKPVTVPVGGLMTVNYSLPDPTGVQGIEYRIDAGPWLRPGGVAPVNGVGGSFTVSGLMARSVDLTLRAVGVDEGGPLVTEATPSTQVTFAKDPTSTPVAPGTVVGSAGTSPVAAPPAQPISAVPGTSNGAGSGSNGALAATTGDPAADAPCLATDGTLYPNQYSTVGSQLTMAPNTRGLGRATSYTVVGGGLAPGIQLDRSAGVLFGVTTTPGSYATTVRARFANGSTLLTQFTTRVEADSLTLQYAAQNIGTVGKVTTIAPSTNARTAGATFRLVCGELPAGTRFDPATGMITVDPRRRC